MDAAQHQVATGMAWYYVQYGRGYEAFREIEATASHSKLGLWRDTNPIVPWDWRATARAQRQQAPAGAVLAAPSPLIDGCEIY